MNTYQTLHLSLGEHLRLEKNGLLLLSPMVMQKFML